MNGVCGSRIASVVPSRAIASLSMSLVNLVMSCIVVLRVIAAFVMVCVVSEVRRFWVVRVLGVGIDAMWSMASGDCRSVSSISDVMHRVRVNL